MGKGIWKETILNTHFYTFDSERYLTTRDVKQIRDLAAHVPYDQIYILVNSKRYGGGGFYNLVTVCTADNELSKKVLVHEFGHGFAGLGDEYYIPGGELFLITAYTETHQIEIETFPVQLYNLAKPRRPLRGGVD